MNTCVYVVCVAILLIAAESIAQTSWSSIGGMNAIPVRRSWTPRDGSTIAYQIRNSSFTIIEAKTGLVVRLEQGTYRDNYAEFGEIHARPSQTGDTSFLIRETIIGGLSLMVTAIETSTGRDLYSIGPIPNAKGTSIGSILFTEGGRSLNLFMYETVWPRQYDPIVKYFSFDLQGKTVEEHVFPGDYQGIGISSRDLFKYFPSYVSLPDSIGSESCSRCSVIVRYRSIIVVEQSLGSWRTLLYDTATRKVLLQTDDEFLAYDDEKFVLLRSQVETDSASSALSVYRWQDPILPQWQVSCALRSFWGPRTSAANGGRRITAGRYVSDVGRLNTIYSAPLLDIQTGNVSPIELGAGDYVTESGNVVTMPRMNSQAVIHRSTFDGDSIDITPVSLGSVAVNEVQTGDNRTRFRKTLRYDYGFGQADRLYQAMIENSRFISDASKGRDVPIQGTMHKSHTHRIAGDSLYIATYFWSHTPKGMPVNSLILEKRHANLQEPARVLYAYELPISSGIKWRNTVFDPHNERTIEVYDSLIIFVESDTTKWRNGEIPVSFSESAVLADSGRYLCSRTHSLRLSDLQIVDAAPWTILYVDRDTKWAVVMEGANIGIADITRNPIVPSVYITLPGSYFQPSDPTGTGVFYIVDSLFAVYKGDSTGIRKTIDQLEGASIISASGTRGFCADGQFWFKTATNLTTWDIRTGRRIQYIEYTRNSDLYLMVSPTDCRPILIAKSGALFWGETPIVTSTDESWTQSRNGAGSSTLRRLVTRAALAEELQLEPASVMVDQRGGHIHSVNDISTPQVILVKTIRANTVFLVIE